MLDFLASHIMARTTLDIDGSVLRDAKKIAKATGRTLGEVVSELMAVGLQAPRRAATSAKFRWESKSMRALVDLDDKDAVLRALQNG